MIQIRWVFVRFPQVKESRETTFWLVLVKDTYFTYEYLLTLVILINVVKWKYSNMYLYDTPTLS